MKLKLSLAAVLMMIGVACNSGGKVAAKSTSKPTLKERGQAMAQQNLPYKKPVKSIQPTTVKTLNGKSITIGQQKPTILLLFASHCMHCQREVPTFSSTFAQLKEQVNLVASSTESEKKIKQFIEEYKGINFNYHQDSEGTLYQTFANRAVPHVILIDKNGKIKRHEAGWDPQYMDKFIEQVKALL